MKKLFLLLLLILCVPFSGATAESGDEKDLKQKAFERSLKSQFPMTPDQILEFKKRMDETKRAANRKKPPKMTNRSRRLSFETGQSPPVVRIAPGYVTTISFFDSTGQPWPVTSVVVGNPNFYSVQRPENQSNIITVSALEEYVNSNLSLTFQDQHVPATVQLNTVAEGKETDSLIVFRAEQRGPNATQPTIGPEPEETVGSMLMDFLDNVPPAEAKQMRLLSSGDQGDRKDWQPPRGLLLWSYQDKLYLRSQHPLLWPAWTAVVNGPGNVRVYELSRVSSVMVSRSGNSTTYQIGGGLYE